jgi:hypothetical protein
MVYHTQNYRTMEKVQKPSNSEFFYLSMVCLKTLSASKNNIESYDDYGIMNSRNAEWT